MRDTDALAELVQRHGAKEVWTTGLRELGHPPTWTPSKSDVSKIEKGLSK